MGDEQEIWDYQMGFIYGIHHPWPISEMGDLPKEMSGI